MATSKSEVNTTGRYAGGPSSRVPPTHDLGDRSPEEIQDRIERTRGAMDETLDELGERLNPRNLVDQALDWFRSSGGQDTTQRARTAANDFAHNLGAQVRDNPIGATLVGVGLAWMALGGRGERHERDEDVDYDAELRRRYSSRADEFGYSSDLGAAAWGSDVDYDPQASPAAAEAGAFGDYYDSDEGKMQSAKRKASSATSAAGKSISGAWESTKDAASSAAESVTGAAKSAAGSIADAASSAAGAVSSAAASAGSATSETSRRGYLRSRAAAQDVYRGTSRFGSRTGHQLSSAAHAGTEQFSAAYDLAARKTRQAHDEYPLALGLGVMALGALAGLAIPRTRREDEWMGEASDELKEQAMHTGEQALERGREAVEHTVEAAKHSAESHGLTGDSLLDRGVRVAEKAVSSISEAAKQEGLHPEQLKKDAKEIAEETTQQAKSEAKKATDEAKSKAQQADADAGKAMSEAGKASSDSNKPAMKATPKPMNKP